MKILLTIFFVFYLLTRAITNPLYECNIRTVFQAIPPLVWYAQTSEDSSQSPIITRFLHNKATIFTNQFARCYANTLDPVEVYRAIGLLGLIFLSVYIYTIFSRKNWILIIIFLSIPIFTVFIDNPKIIDNYYKIFSFIGFTHFLKKFK